jgi:hypothetical protein
MICRYCDRDTYIEPPFYGCSNGCQKHRIKAATIREERCENCDDDQNLEVDHAIPRSRGGCECKYNLWTLCRRCNRSKGTMTIEEFYNSGVAGWCVEQTAREWREWIEEGRIEQDKRLLKIRSKA